MADEYEIKINTDIDSGGVSAFISQVTAALAEIEDRADTAAKRGTSTGGLSRGFERLRSRSGDAIRGAGLNDRDTQRELARLNEVFRRSAESISRAVPTFRTPLVTTDDQRNLRELQRQRALEEMRSASRLRNDGYEDENEEGISRVEAATRAKRNSALFNNRAAENPAYRDAALQEAIGLKRTNTSYNNSLANSDDYKQAYGANASSEQARIAAENEAVVADEDYAREVARATEAIAARRAVEAEAGNTVKANSLAAQAELAKQRSRNAIGQQVAGSQTPEDLSNTATLKLSEARNALAVKLEEQLGTTDADITAQADLTTAMRTNAARLAEAMDESGGNAAEVRRRLAVQGNDTAVKTGVLAGTDTDAQGALLALQAQTNYATQLAKLSAVSEEDITSAAQLKIAQDDYAAKLQAEIDELSGKGPRGKGTLFQRFQARNDPSADSDPTTKRTFGQFVGSHAANTLGYAVPGLAFGVGIEELSQSVEEAEKAQKVFAELDAQFQALGQGDQLSGFTQSIKSISDNTGLAVSEVAELGMAMKGVYGNTQQATIALQGVSEGAVAMGLNISEAQQDFTAITQSFTQFSSQGGAAITSVSNEVLHLQDLTGVDGKNILEGTADAASSMQQLGIGFKPTASLVAAASEKSGLPTDTIGQTLAKVADGITQNFGAIADVVRDGPGGAAKANALNKDNPTQTLDAILQDFKSMSSGQQLDIESSLGVNASARPAINALVEAATHGANLAKTTAPADRTQEEFKKQMDTLEGSFDRLRQELVNFGVGLIDGPFGKAIVEFADALGNATKFVTDLGKWSGGVTTAFVELVTAAVGLRAGIMLLQAANLPGLARSFLGLGTASATTATEVAADGNASAIAATKIAASGTESLAGGTAVAGGDTAIIAGGGGGDPDDDDTSGLALGSVSTLMSAALAGYAGYKIGSELNKHLGISKRIADVLEPNTDGKQSWQASVAIGSNPYATKATEAGNGRFSTAGGLVGKQYTAKEQAAMQKWLTTIETETNAMSLHATAEQKYAIKLDEEYANMGSENAYHNLETVFNDLGHNKAGQDSIRESKAEAASTADRANPDTVHVLGAQRDQQQAAALKAAVEKKNQVLTEAARDAAAQMTNYQGIDSAYAAGQVSMNTLIKSSQEVAQEAQATYNKSDTVANYQALETAIQNETTNLDQIITEQTAATQALAQTGNVQADQANVQRLAASIKTLKTPAAMLQTAQGIVTAMQTQVQDEANMATSLSAQNKILETGVTASASQLAAYNKAQIANGLKPVSSLTIKGQAVTPTETLAALNQTTQAVQAQGVAAAKEDPVAVAIANYHAAMATVANDLAAGYGKGTDQYKSDEATAVEALQTVVDAQNQVKEAQDSLTQAYQTAGLNAVSAAQSGIKLAEQQLADAHGLAAQKAAEASIVQANATYNQSVTSLLVAKTQTAAALAGEQGNDVQQAYDTFVAAQQQLQRDTAYAKSHGTTAASSQQIQSDQANAYNAESQYYQEQISNLETISNEQVFLGQETLTQQIANYEVELKKVRGNTLLTEQVLDDIRTVQNSAGGNLDFSIPTNLLVSPTLYQGERLNQMSGGYTDNKQVTVNITVNGTNTANAVNKLLQATGATTGTSTTSMPTSVLSSR